MAERTPGAWFAERPDRPDDDRDWGVYVVDPDSVDPADPDLICVATVPSEADARLMAAAPDLLDACRALLCFNAELCTDVGVSTHYPSAETARIAIAKAEGVSS